MKIRRLLAVWSAHCIKFACQLTGKQGATLAGKAALTIYPPILGEPALTCSMVLLLLLF